MSHLKLVIVGDSFSFAEAVYSHYDQLALKDAFPFKGSWGSKDFIKLRITSQCQHVRENWRIAFDLAHMDSRPITISKRTRDDPLYIDTKARAGFDISDHFMAYVLLESIIYNDDIEEAMSIDMWVEEDDKWNVADTMWIEVSKLPINPHGMHDFDADEIFHLSLLLESIDTSPFSKYFCLKTLISPPTDVTVTQQK